MAQPIYSKHRRSDEGALLTKEGNGETREEKPEGMAVARASPSEEVTPGEAGCQGLFTPRCYLRMSPSPGPAVAANPMGLTVKGLYPWPAWSTCTMAPVAAAGDLTAVHSFSLYNSQQSRCADYCHRHRGPERSASRPMAVWLNTGCSACACLLVPCRQSELVHATCPRPAAPSHV